MCLYIYITLLLLTVAVYMIDIYVCIYITLLLLTVAVYTIDTCVCVYILHYYC